MIIAENWINDIALTLNEDPAKVREKNLFRKGQKTHFNQEIEEDALYRCWQKCLKQSGYYETREELETFNNQHRFKKRGISIIPTMFGISFTVQYMNQAGK